ncbi:MAG: AI-2E family transporter [Desulfosarcinaceae bacterium]
MRTSEILLSLAAFVVIIAGMKAATGILIPFILSAFIAIISAPPMFWLQRKGVPSLLAMLIVVACILLAGVIIGALVGQSINDFMQDLPVYKAKIKTQTTAILAWLATKGVKTQSLALDQVFDPGAAMNLAAQVLNGLGNVLTNSFLILMTVIFMLLEAAGFPNKVKAITDAPEQQLARIHGFMNDVKQYIAIKTWVSLATGVVIALWLILLGVDYPLLWGLLAFVLNYVPNIGSIIAAVPAVLLALIQIGAGSALAAAAGYVVVNVAIGSFVEPRFMGRGLGLSTLVVFLSLLFWGWVLGPVGMLLSVPLTITAKLALDSRDDTRWLAVMLGSEKAVKLQTVDMKTDVDSGKDDSLNG